MPRSWRESRIGSPSCIPCNKRQCKRKPRWQFGKCVDIVTHSIKNRTSRWALKALGWELGRYAVMQGHCHEIGVDVGGVLGGVGKEVRVDGPGVIAVEQGAC